MTTTPSTTVPTRLNDAPAPRLRAALDERRLLFCGVIVGILTLIGLAVTVVFFATSHPTIDATPVEAATGFRDAAGMVALATFLMVLPFPFALLFLGALDTVLHRAAGGALVRATISAGVAAFLIPVIGSLVSSIAPAIGAADASVAAGAVVKAIDGVMPLSVALAGLPRAVFLIGVVVILARAGLAGRGLTITGYAIAGLGLVGTATFFVQALFPLASLSALLFVVWISVLSVRLRRRSAGNR